MCQKCPTTWHDIVGHCDDDDLQQLQGVAKGTRIKGSAVKPTKLCEGKLPWTRNNEPDGRADAPLELVNTELMGPRSTFSTEGVRYAQSFTDDYSGVIAMYLLKSRTDAVRATERFLMPFGEVGRVCSVALTLRAMPQALLTKYKIRHETFPAHTAESSLLALYDMSTCWLRESHLPDVLRNYAVQTSACVRNGWNCRRTSGTPYELLRKKPDVSKLQRFGSVCFTFKQGREKMDLRREKGLFGVLPRHKQGSEAQIGDMCSQYNRK